MSNHALPSFELAGGTVTGRGHVTSGRANQDAFTWLVGPTTLVAVVADGCGSGAHSEVGAKLGARILVERLSRSLAEGQSPSSPEMWSALRLDLLATLRPLALAMGGSLSEVVSEYFLFTVVGVALGAEEGCVFAAGDGISVVDGVAQRLGPFPRNEPPYLGYGLLDWPFGFVTHRVFATRDLSTALIGTDGAADLHDLASNNAAVEPLSRFCDDDRYFRNRDAIRRQLALLNRESHKPIWAERRVVREAGLLHDDTTIIALRRRG